MGHRDARTGLHRVRAPGVLMEVAVRPRLDRARVERLVRDALGPVEFTAHEEFTDGYFNAAHALDTADGRRLVVKIAPDKGLKLQRYEADLMGAEIDCFERAIAAGVPMPRLWHGDPDRGLMIMDRLSGVTLLSVRETLSREELHGLRREIGALSARFRDATGEHFGYRRPSGRTAADTWSAAFAAMAADAAADVADGPGPPGSPCPSTRSPRNSTGRRTSSTKWTGPPSSTSTCGTGTCSSSARTGAGGSRRSSTASAPSTATRSPSS
nr:hypothetical protein GCM10025732_25100 [Glycomyces mayteni]